MIAALAVGVWLLCALIHLLLARQAHARHVEAEAQWAEATRFAEVGQLQANVIGECHTLLCDDCRAIVHGHYMTAAFPAVQALIDEANRYGRG